MIGLAEDSVIVVLFLLREHALNLFLIILAAGLWRPLVIQNVARGDDPRETVEVILLPTRRGGLGILPAVFLGRY